MRYNLKFRNLTFYGLTRPQSIRKLKQISGQTILSSPQDVEFNPNSAKKNATLLSVNLLFSLIAAFSSDTTYRVPGIASHTFMFSFRLAISLKNCI